jgi:hypothetical protein
MMNILAFMRQHHFLPYRHPLCRIKRCFHSR